MSKQNTKRAQARAKKLAAKRATMGQPGYKSKYALRKAARQRGEPMAARPVQPWWGSLSFHKAPAPKKQPTEQERAMREAYDAAEDFSD